MEILRIIIATLVGTSLMTAFSYLVSEAYRKTFKEPVLLNYVIRLSGITLNDRNKSIVGWIIHYILGLLFVIAYHFIWVYGILDMSWTSALILGAVSGIIGIIGWVIIFSLPSKEPRVAFTSYYIQLFFAHIVFAAGVVLVYRWF